MAVVIQELKEGRSHCIGMTEEESDKRWDGEIPRNQII